MSWRKWLGRALVLMTAYARWAECAPPGYVDPAVCAGCHRQIAESYSKTGMARSFGSASVDRRRPELEPANYDHAASRQHFTSLRRDDKYYVRRTTIGPSGSPTGAFDERVDYVIGSGARAVSYLHRTRDDRLVEIPITWYPQNGGRWAMSPAYDRPDHPGFSRTISYRCMFCHNGYPDVPGGPGSWDGATVFPAQLPEGIDCQRCHGPGAGHVAAARQGKPLSEIRAAIVNPARLTPERQMEVCMQCHLETTSLQLPGAMLRLGRGVFSYRPGEPLSDYILYFDHAPGNGHDDKFEFVSTAYRLRKSACFEAGEGRLTCTSCHDPHQELSREDVLRRTDRACAACHESAIASLVSQGRHTAVTDCASCHMPRRQGVDAIHVTVTDHRIQRAAKSPVAVVTVEEHDGNTLPYAGEVVPYYPKLVGPLDAAVAQVKGLANLPGGLARLEKLLAESPPKDAAPYFEMGQALAGTAQAGRAIPFYEQAVKTEPGNWRYWYGLAQALQATGRMDRGLVALERAAALEPQDTKVLQGLGVAYGLAGRIPDALRTLRSALDRNPEDAAAQSNLGETLVRAGDLDKAQEAFREAVRLRPEERALRMSLADVLIQVRQFREAASQLEEAIRIGPSTETARAAWFAGLAATGNLPAARSHYDQSLRRQTSEVHADLGTALISMGDAGAAIREYRLAVDSDPQSPVAVLNLGLTLADHGQAVEARRWLEQALRLDPQQPAAHLKLGELLLAASLRSEGLAHLKIAAAAADPRIRSAAEKLLQSAK
jgi:predicted CXXCH cytochrome family protein